MVEKIVEYGVCAAHTDGELCEQVNDKLKEGYELHGHIFTTIQYDQLFFHQALILKKVIRKKQVKKKSEPILKFK